MAEKAPARYEQGPGNKIYTCPACKEPAIQTVCIPPSTYVCPISKTIVPLDLLLSILKETRSEQ